MEKPPGTSGPNRNRNSLKNYAKYSAIGFQMAAIILLGQWGGMKLDEYFELSSPIFTVILTFLAFGAALYYLFRGITKG
mgnify:CR=1 FL=1